MDRAAALARLTADRFDVLVIGGGITGCGVARDAALRGLSTALVEQDDFASGTSSRSSRLVHGGVRYLEHGHLGLVFEASRERRALLALAPHLVRPLRFTWPVYEGARVARWKLRAGLALYDALALFRNVGAHHALDAAAVREAEPLLAAEGLTGGAQYWDAATSDTRLTIANAVAASEAGAAVANHLAVRRILRDPSGDVRGAAVEDTITGRELEVAARAVVTATGPWSDETRALDAAAGAGDAGAAVRGTKGVHAAVPRGRVGNHGAITVLSPLDGRVMFVLPAGALSIVGTTDTETAMHPSDVRATEEDVAYLLAAANTFFPAARLTRGDVVSAWAGIRPLVAASHTGSAASASREHHVDVARGVVGVTGGKLTTYRSMAAEVVDDVERLLGRRATRATTGRLLLPGGDVHVDAEVEAASDATRAHDVGERLVSAHGSRWRRVWALAEADPPLAAPIVEGSPYVGAEAVYAVRAEQAVTLADILVRRVPLAFETRDQGRAAARAVAPLVRRELGWDEAAMASALARYDAEAARIFDVEP